MAMTFDATLKDMGRESPHGFLLTDAYLLTGLRVRRDAAARIFGGIRIMHESDTYLAIIDEGQEKGNRDAILIFGEERLGPPTDTKRRSGTTAKLLSTVTR